jgi:hypothetical protein
MFGSGKKGNAAKKAYEIAYALFRISANISELSVKERLESQAIDLLVATNSEAFENTAKVVAAIDALMKFAIDLNIVSIVNGDIMLREISAMHDLIIENLDKSDDVDVSKFFSKAKDVTIKDVVSASSSVSVIPALRPSVASGEGGKIGVTNPPRKMEVLDTVLGREGREETVASGFSPTAPASSQIVSVGVGVHDFSRESGNPAIGIIKSGERQIAILDRIRQSGNCKLRDIQEVLPGCSERTIRYDLEELIERNLIERIGAGGPAVAYRIRQSA